MLARFSPPTRGSFSPRLAASPCPVGLACCLAVGFGPCVCVDDDLTDLKPLSTGDDHLAVGAAPTTAFSTVTLF